ncbi:MAG: OmpH family outer membrane protein [Termitinemataceae bacterium]|nr:MAG: OmpH family outer membrane protein [Termitinemataceae bacterium]
MNKLHLLLLLLLCFFMQAFSLSAQQITRFAVVDLGRVYSTFSDVSKSAKDFNDASAKVQDEINKRQTEIQNLRTQKADADQRGDTAAALKLDKEIADKSNSLKLYFQTETKKLEDQQKKLTSTGSSVFLEQLNNEIRYVAESEGYSMVFSKTETKGMLWYSQSVDITDKLINSLRAKQKK